MTEGPLPDDAVVLFREAPEDFVTARERLAATLREHGRADDARVVKALRKPTVVAWALDQLCVRDPDGVRNLLDAGAEVRAAQQGALSSKRGAAERLQAASGARKGAVAHLTAVAVAALAERGASSDAHGDALTRALETCSIDADAGARLSAGTFERPPAASTGFGEMFGLTSIEGGRLRSATPANESIPRDPSPSDAPATTSTAGSGASDPKQAPASETEPDLGALRRDLDAAVRRAKKARQSADGFAHELDGMRRRLEVVEHKHARAAATAAEAETELARAEKAMRSATERP